MTQDQGRQRRRAIGIGFITAFVLSTATIIYTGLNVRAPGSHRTQAPSTEAPAQVTDTVSAEQPEDEAAASETTQP